MYMILLYDLTTGGHLGDWEGRFPQIEGEVDGPRIRPRNILRSTVIGCEAKY